MREDLADLVYPVLAYLIRKRDALDRGDPLEVDKVQADLRASLKSPAEAQRLPDFGGDGGDFLGVRYALACWLDERLWIHRGRAPGATVSWKKRCTEPMTGPGSFGTRPGSASAGKAETRWK